MNFSIIVPVYNAEKFLVKCLDSIFAQEFSGTFEVIAIDDSSIDNSLIILKKYQKKEVRLIIIEHEYNKKQAVARATGMRAAKGDYIMHVDSDDWLLPGTLERLFHISVKFNPDVILFNCKYEFSNGKNLTNELLIEKEGLSKDKNSIQKYFYGNSATKCVKRNLTENMITGEETINSIADDLLYCSEILLRANSFYLLPETYYVAYFNFKSLSRTTNTMSILNSLTIIIKHLKKITVANKAETILVNNILIQIENKIFSYALPLWLSEFSIKAFNVSNLINSFKLFSEMTDERLNEINFVFKKRRFAFYYSYKNFGLFNTIKIVLGTIYYKLIVSDLSTKLLSRLKLLA